MNSLNIVKKIDHIAIYPNRNNTNLNNIIIAFRDNNNHPFILYSENIDSNVSISAVQEFISKAIISHKFTLEMNIFFNNKEIICKIIDLNPSKKEMTKKDIEKLLGYEIEIIE